MGERGATREQIWEALKQPHTSYEAHPRPGVPLLAWVFVGAVQGHDLKIWVEPNTSPVRIRSVGWRDEA